MKPAWMDRHLGGDQPLAFYLLDQASRVWCTCVDFDNKADNPDPDWQAKGEKLHLWLGQGGLFPLVEISQSGKAAHVWLFFEEPTEAWIPRAFWRNAAKKLDILFREVYPRQDRHTGKGFGNAVRYPLWNLSRFVDPESDWATIDPIKALEGIKRTSAAELKALAYELAMEMKPEEEGSGRYQSLAATMPDGELPPRVKARLSREGTLLYKRWHGDRTGMKDESNSALVVSIACELVRQLVPTPEIAAAIRYWCRERAYEKGESDRAISRALSVAYEYVFQRKEEGSANTTEMKEACHAYINTLERGQPAYVPSGVAALDNSVDGIAWGEMAVIAARPGHGKSALALQWLDYAASQGTPCLILSEEMSVLELGKRALTSLTKWHPSNWEGEVITLLRQDVDRHYQGRAPIYVVESCNSIDRAEDVIDGMCSDKAVRLVAVDYLQLLGARGQKRYEQVTDVSRRLKQAAQRNGCALIACCQVNREVEGRTDNKYCLADLRDSGSIEQDADLVLFLKWSKMFDESMPETEYHIFVAKRRNGPIRKRDILTDFFPERQHIGPFPLENGQRQS
jgi:replicative DNA helicase